MPPYNQPSYQRYLRLLGILVALALLIYLVILYISSLHFHVTNTSPNTDAVSISSPFIKINFNRPLANKGISLTSSFSVASSYSVQGKTLTVNLNTPLAENYGYYIKINIIADTKGDKITNKLINFTPKNISFGDLSSDQQQAILKAQASHPTPKAAINFQNTAALINAGVTTAQVNNLEQEFFQFKSSAKQVVIDAQSVKHKPRNPNVDTSFTIYFTVAVDNTSYNAEIDYTNLQTVRLHLFDTGSGAQVFDSGNISTGG